MSNKLEYYGGDGYDGLPENGKYYVSFRGDNHYFSSLKKARLFYDNINEGKALWSIISFFPELIDAHEAPKIKLIYENT